MADILLITVMERNKRTGRDELVTSHGINLETDKTVITSCEHPQKLGARFDQEAGEWILKDPHA